MTRITTENFPARLQHNSQYSDKSIDVIEKNNLLENKDFKSLKKYIVGDWKTYFINEVEFYFERLNYPKSVICDNFTHGIDSIIFHKCVFDCEVTIHPNSGKLKFIFFIDCQFNQKLTISGSIQDYLIIKDSKVNADLIFSGGSYVKTQILLTKSSFENIIIDTNFQSDKFSLVDDCKINNNLILAGTQISEIQIHNSYIKGNFENSRIENQHSDVSQSLSFYKFNIGGNIDLKNNRNIIDIIFNEVDATGHLKAICYGKKISFEGKNTFKNISLQGSLDNIKFEKANIFGQIAINEDSSINYLQISSSKIEHDIIIRKSSIKLLRIDEHSQLKALLYEDSNSSYIDIKNADFKGLLTIDSTFIERIIIYNCRVYDNFSFASSTIEAKKTTSLLFSYFFVEGTCSIGNSNFLSIDIDNTVIARSLSFSRIKVDNNFIIRQLSSDTLRIDENSKFKSISFYQLYTSLLNLENIIIDSNKINFNCCRFDELYHFDLPKYEFLFEYCNINEVNFSEKTNPKDNIYTFIKCSFSLLKISNFNNLGNLFFRGIKPKYKNLLLQNFRKELLEKIQKTGILDVKIEQEYEKPVGLHYPQYVNSPIVIFDQSSLGKAEFTDFDFEGFEFSYNNSKITETFISGGTLPKTIEIPKLIEEDSPTDYYIQKVGAYNQFKKVFESQGDNFQSTYFQAKAAENQALLLKEQKKSILIKNKESSKNWFQKIKTWINISFFSHNAFERLTFWFNKISNRHGESWVQALKFIFFISIIFFNLYCWLSRKYELTNNISWNDFEKILGDYVSFLDPTQKIKEDINGLGKLAIFVSKIFIGYGIFQLIAAFRKHGKKSS